MLFFQVRRPLRKAFPVALDFRDGHQRRSVSIEDDGRGVVIEQDPFAVAVFTAREKDLERVVARDPAPASTLVTELLSHFRDPSRVRRAAQAEAVREQAGPVFARPHVLALLETLSPDRKSTRLNSSHVALSRM